MELAKASIARGIGASARPRIHAVLSNSSSPNRRSISKAASKGAGRWIRAMRAPKPAVVTRITPIAVAWTGIPPGVVKITTTAPVAAPSVAKRARR